MRLRYNHGYLDDKFIIAFRIFFPGTLHSPVIKRHAIFIRIGAPSQVEAPTVS